MRVLQIVALCAALIAHPAFALTDEQKIARCTFVNEFIRELSAAQQLRDIFEQNGALNISGPAEISTILRTSTQASWELGTTRRLLDTNELDPATEAIRVELRKIYDLRIAMNGEIIEDAKKLLSSETTSDEERNVDYDALATKVSELASRNDEFDESIFDLAKNVGVSLIDNRENERGLLDHLILTKDERQRMAKILETSFRSSRSDKARNYITGAAWLIHDWFLRSRYKSADDPW